MKPSDVTLRITAVDEASLVIRALRDELRAVRDEMDTVHRPLPRSFIVAFALLGVTGAALVATFVSGLAPVYGLDATWTFLAIGWAALPMAVIAAVVGLLAKRGESQ